MRKIEQLLAVAILALAGGAASAAPNEPPTRALAPDVQQHVDKAYAALDGQVSQRMLPGSLYVVDPKNFPPPVPAMRKLPSLPATRMFDHFYYLGVNWVSAWALDTKDGIVVFDTLTSPAEATQYIEGGLRQAGLDPARIKWIILTHGHPDHYGGAKSLADKYHAKVLMSDADWTAVAQPGGNAAADAATHPDVPARDTVLTDGETLTFGGTKIRVYITPGHTAGTASFLIPVTDHGKPHMLSLLGGMGLTRIVDPAHDGTDVLEKSLTRFEKLSLAAKADAVISSHPFLDDSYDKAKLVQDGQAGAASPWVVGTDGVRRYYDAAIEATRAIAAYDRAKVAGR